MNKLKIFLTALLVGSLITIPALATTEDPTGDYTTKFANKVSLYGKTGGGDNNIALLPVKVDAAGRLIVNLDQKGIDLQVAGTTNIVRQSSSQLLGSGDLNFTTTFNRPVRITQVLFTASASVTQTLKTTFNSAQGAVYDTVLDSVSLSSATDDAYIPNSRGILLAIGDEITVTCTNTGSPAVTVYVTVMGVGLN